MSLSEPDIDLLPPQSTAKETDCGEPRKQGVFS
uniref:Uncharacterized protein n=1 Tax=Arundo donax TaxID=35708 RepID=A0A0A9FJ08_ARUDO